MDIRTVYEDNLIIVCVKPVGVESENAGMPALLASQCGLNEVFCVHRLDKGVGGLMVFAKTKFAASRLSAAVSSGEMKKEYLAVLPGRPAEGEAVLCDLLFRDSSKNKSYVVKRMRRGVKEAELAYRVLAVSEPLTLVQIKLHTGRTHQIRVQFSSRGLPLLGDVKYGSTIRQCPIALFSCALSFPHPKTGKPLHFEALPEECFPWSEFTQTFTENKES